MKWNWQRKNWPNFTYDTKQIEQFEAEYLKQSGSCSGAVLHLTTGERESLIIDILSSEAFSTSEIEGEILNRSSVQSSLRRNFGLNTDNTRIPPAEKGIAEVMINLYKFYNKPLNHQELFLWHKLIMSGRKDLKEIGNYRTHKDAMQIISGPLYNPKVHFEAPPSQIIRKEMDKFVAWFNSSYQKYHNNLTRAAIAHIYFESIHPFEDGNGRIGRALVIKSLSQSLEQPALIELSRTIQKNKKQYYDALALNNKDLDITGWIIYFAKVILEAQETTIKLIEFLIVKIQLFAKIGDIINDRQSKVLLRIFKEGPDGFKGGLSAENYISITNTSRATATRDLQELVEMGVLKKEGSLKGTRYYITD